MTMKNINKIVIMALSLWLLNGCTGLMNNNANNHFTSKVNLKNFKLNQSLSKEMIAFIQNYYPNSKTTFYFQLDQSAYEQGSVIENALRNVGYGVSYIKEEGRIPFAYKIDFIAKNIIRTTYNIGSSTLSRLYKVQGERVKAISAFTTRGFRKALYRKNTHLTSNHSNYKKAIVTITTLRVRNKPSRKGKVIGKYHKDALVYVEAPIENSLGEAWSKVIQRDSQGNAIYSNDTKEYIASKYLNYLN
ncbi:MAG: Unknown protein [uncultured Sulfurovum sp.]|uniref:Uncharacterized protein n=1 Tax=uncultured Sulfurovum sp. TaxID=269237 RepID=A0A6S6S030_9BACT|nr:MAG: Unknown protein [uncultured Sulfurovum sp.]